MLTVLLPFRDASATVAAAIRSVLAEPCVEAVVAVDDGSVDASRAEVDSVADPRVLVVRGEGKGIVAALNLGLTQVRTEVVARMDADDLSRPGRLAASLEALRPLPASSIVGCRTEILADVEVQEGLRRYVAWQNEVLTAESHQRELFVESPIVHPTFVLRTAALRALGGYRDGPFAEDYDLLLRADAAGGALVKLPLVGLDWRHTGGRLTFRDPRYAPEGFRRLKAEHLAARLRDEPRAIALWGAGRDGRRMLRALRDAGVPVTRALDLDPRKVGSTVQGLPIDHYESLRGPVDELVLACVGTRGARQDIRAELARRGYREPEDARLLA